MNQEPDQTKEQHSYEDQFASSSSNEGAVILPTSINDNEFQLVYQAKEESVGGIRICRPYAATKQKHVNDH